MVESIRTLMRKMRELVMPGRLESELDAELAFHVEMETAKHIAAGDSPDVARKRALRDFGGVDRYAEATRDARRIPWLEETLRDIRIGARQLRRTPSFTIVAVLTLALAIGANTAIFSVINGVLLAPAPFVDADRMVLAWETDRSSKTDREPGSWPDYKDYKARVRSFDRLEALYGADVTLTLGTSEPTRVGSILITHGYFDMLGIKPILGRTFTPQEDLRGGPLVVAIGENLWRSRFASDPQVLGRSLRMNDVTYQIVAVMPRHADFGIDQLHTRVAYHGPFSGAGDVDVWTPLQASDEQLPRDTHPIIMVGRLAPKADVASAQKEMATIAAELERTYPVNAARGAHVESLDDVVFGPIRPALALLIGAVIIVLLVGCLNVAGLLLARGTVRSREISVRVALGAGVGRLARQFASETLLLALLGGTCGILLAYGGLHALIAIAPADIPRISEVHIDTRVLLLTLGVSVAAGVIFGLVPTFQALGINVGHALREGRSSAGRERSRARSTLVVAEVAIAVMLLIASTLLIRSFGAVLKTDPGFDASGVLKAEFQLPNPRYPRDRGPMSEWNEIRAFNAEVTRRIKALPGVQSVALAGNHPLDAGFTSSFNVPGREAEAEAWPEITIRFVSEEYFATLSLPVLRGRAVNASDDSKAPLVVAINQAAADLAFNGRDPVGQMIGFWGTGRRIAGVVGNERMHGVTAAAPPAVYIPMTQAPVSSVVLVRTAGDPMALANDVRTAIWSVDPALALYGIESLETTLSTSVGQRKFTMLIVSAFGALAIVLALIGVHGMLSYTASQRTREFGIRLALGATRGNVQRVVVGGGLRLAALGVALGVAGALWATRWISALLYGVVATDPRSYAAVIVFVLLSAGVACWLPAMRATRAQALEALRAE